MVWRYQGTLQKNEKASQSIYDLGRLLRRGEMSEFNPRWYDASGNQVHGVELQERGVEFFIPMTSHPQGAICAEGFDELIIYS